MSRSNRRGKHGGLFDPSSETSDPDESMQMQSRREHPADLRRFSTKLQAYTQRHKSEKQALPINGSFGRKSQVSRCRGRPQTRAAMWRRIKDCFPGSDWCSVWKVPDV